MWLDTYWSGPKVCRVNKQINGNQDKLLFYNRYPFNLTTDFDRLFRKCLLTFFNLTTCIHYTLVNVYCMVYVINYSFLSTY